MPASDWVADGGEVLGQDQEVFACARCTPEERTSNEALGWRVRPDLSHAGRAGLGPNTALTYRTAAHAATSTSLPRASRRATIPKRYRTMVRSDLSPRSLRAQVNTCALVLYGCTICSSVRRGFGVLHIAPRCSTVIAHEFSTADLVRRQRSASSPRRQESPSCRARVLLTKRSEAVSLATRVLIRWRVASVLPARSAASRVRV